MFGERRDEISLLGAADAYFQRFDIEHFFRFDKRRLLLTRFQTPKVSSDEHWWEISVLDYLQLWIPKDLAKNSWRRWQCYLDKGEQATRSLSRMQRNMT